MNESEKVEELLTEAARAFWRISPFGRNDATAAFRAAARRYSDAAARGRRFPVAVPDRDLPDEVLIAELLDTVVARALADPAAGRIVGAVLSNIDTFLDGVAKRTRTAEAVRQEAQRVSEAERLAALTTLPWAVGTVEANSIFFERQPATSTWSTWRSRGRVPEEEFKVGRNPGWRLDTLARWSCSGAAPPGMQPLKLPPGSVPQVVDPVGYAVIAQWCGKTPNHVRDWADKGCGGIVEHDYRIGGTRAWERSRVHLWLFDHKRDLMV